MEARFWISNDYENRAFVEWKRDFGFRIIMRTMNLANEIAVLDFV